MPDHVADLVNNGAGNGVRSPIARKNIDIAVERGSAVGHLHTLADAVNLLIIEVYIDWRIVKYLVLA